MVNFYDKFVVCPPNKKLIPEISDVAGTLFAVCTLYKSTLNQDQNK